MARDRVKPVTITLPEDVAYQLHVESYRAGLTKSVFVEHAIFHYVKKLKGDKANGIKKGRKTR